MLGQLCCSLDVTFTRVLEKLDLSVAWGVPTQGSTEVAVVFHVLGRRCQEFSLSPRFMIPFSSRIQFGFLCAVSLSQQVATHCEADPESEQQLPEKMQLSVVSGGCKCSLWKLFDVTDLTMNQEGKEKLALSTV